MSIPRRTFLQWVTGATVAAGLAAAGLDVVVPRSMLIWDRSVPLFPGLPLRVGLRSDAPGPCHVTVTTRHDSVSHTAPVCTLQPGESRQIELPYAYDRLVPGVYQVELAAMTTDASHQDRRALGEMRVAGLRFGA